MRQLTELNFHLAVRAGTFFRTPFLGGNNLKISDPRFDCDGKLLDVLVQSTDGNMRIPAKEIEFRPASGLLPPMFAMNQEVVYKQTVETYEKNVQIPVHGKIVGIYYDLGQGGSGAPYYYYRVLFKNAKNPLQIAERDLFLPTES